ncbi:ABC transporter ATP-binding protein [Georgenia thermotolerans]|uniref:ATP-binding cassette domain-containing protein n=1 Tax=Georgenia thermotolerans TaxID=527326 RepID=A0A7J5UTD7_9MICO|nr:ABC transporter ATP-binding protein [Georgenia thermotolerans]KAE8765538.1 ATP-binding cassette domain-containing protein [Georgenia thermotolerans]
MITTPAPPTPAAPHEPVARVERVTKRYGEGPGAVVALDDVSLAIAPARLTAVMGPSGSGKSTLMHVMAGLDTPTSGRAWIGGTEITTLGDEDLTAIRRRQVGFVFQAFNLVPTMDVLGNVYLPFELDDHTPTDDQRAWVHQLVERLGLADRLSHRPGELSGGQQQRVAIARALATRPDLVLADEPTGNLDSRSGAEVLGLLADAADTLGQSIVMVTHDAAAAAHASRVVFIADGRLVHELATPTRAEIAEVMLHLEESAAARAAHPAAGRLGRERVA